MDALELLDVFREDRYTDRPRDLTALTYANQKAQPQQIHSDTSLRGFVCPRSSDEDGRGKAHQHAVRLVLASTRAD